MATKHQGKLIKKRPSLKTLNNKQIKSTIFIKSQTPYLSALKRTKKMLTKLPQGQQHVTLYAMGKAVTKSLSLACYFQQHSYRVGIYTKTIEVIDEILNEDEEEQLKQEQKTSNVECDIDMDDVDTELKLRKLSGVEIRIHNI